MAQEQINNALNSSLAPISLSYPSDLGSKTRAHKIIFTIYQQDPAQYEKNSSQVLSGAAGFFGGSFVGDQISGAAENSSSVIGKNFVSGALGASSDVLGMVSGAIVGSVGASQLLNLSSTRFNKQTVKTKGTIALYMPNTVNQAQHLSWHTISLTEAFGMTGLGAQIGTSILDKFKENPNIKEAISKLPNDALPGGIEFGGIATEKYNAADYALSLAGYAINPQVEVMFKGVDLRTFQYDFLFSPKDSGESKDIVEIIKSFRKYSAPTIAKVGSGRYFDVPHFFGIDYFFGDGINPNLPKISSCVLETINVDYSPNGWVTFEDGMPVQIRLVLQFKETQIIHQGLIDEGY